MSLASHLARVAEAGGDAVAIDAGGQVVTWRSLGKAIAEFQGLLSHNGLPVDSPTGLLGRNRLPSVCGFVSILGSGSPLVLINALRPERLIAEELEDLAVGCLVGGATDLTPKVLKTAERVGTMAVAVSVQAGEIFFEAMTKPSSGPFRSQPTGVLIEIQTSGTTGAPKRIAIKESTIETSLRDGVRTSKGAVEQVRLAPKTSPALMFNPLVHTSGTFNTLMALFEVRPIVLFEKFDPSVYREALIRHRPKFAPIPPTALKMLLDSNVTRADFSSVLAVRAGTAPLPLKLQEEFEEKFGVPVLTTYGATEFMGAATSWTLDDYKEFGTRKRGSVGRASKGVQIRVVDPQTFDPLPIGEHGLLEAKIDRVDGGRHWIRTTDLARLDEDGFLFILGRVDDAINRGGFKVMAGKIADVLKTFPGVFDAAVIGRPDERLGEVPVGIIEEGEGQSVDSAGLIAHAKSLLAPYEVPARVHVVDKLPRTVSEKICLPEVRELVDALERDMSAV